MKLIGLTGGIGSGKTTVANFFKELGIAIYIADDEAKKLMQQNPIKEELIALFGAETYTDSGELNRKMIADKVFNNSHLLDKLNGIVHPRVEADFKNWVAQQTTPYIIYEAAILFETGKYKQFDYTILVTASKESRISRLKKRDRSNAEEIESRMNNQWSDEKKAELANYILKNEDLIETKKKVHRLHKILLKL